MSPPAVSAGLAPFGMPSDRLAVWSSQYDTRLQSNGMPELADPDGIRVLQGSLDRECMVG